MSCLITFSHPKNPPAFIVKNMLNTLAHVVIAKKLSFLVLCRKAIIERIPPSHPPNKKRMNMSCSRIRYHWFTLFSLSNATMVKASTFITNKYP